MTGAPHNPKLPAVSVLLTVYELDSAAWLDECLASLDAQTIRAGQIVLVVDGPIPIDTESTIQRWKARMPLSVIRLENNRGLGYALNVGLQACGHELVARMDADDIALPDRLEAQLRFCVEHPEVDVLGGWMQEFSTDATDTTGPIRRVPGEHALIARGAKLRNPMNHMTVLFKRSVVLAAGGYKPMRLIQDYELWMRLLATGAKFANLQQVLVKARAGNDLVRRRGGWSYLRAESVLLWSFYRSRFLGLHHLVFGLTIRSIVRLAPTSLRKLAYLALRRE